MNEHEIQLIKSFIIENKKERYLSKLKGKRRQEILEKLNHYFDFIPDFIEGSDEKVETSTKLIQLINKYYKGENVYILADDKNIDGKTFNVYEGAEKAINSFFGVIISCIPGKVAFYRAEQPSNWKILRK